MVVTIDGCVLWFVSDLDVSFVPLYYRCGGNKFGGWFKYKEMILVAEGYVEVCVLVIVEGG